VSAVVQGKLKNIMERWISEFTETIKKTTRKPKVSFAVNVVSKCFFRKRTMPL
jgi:hypothetical protein